MVMHLTQCCCGCSLKTGSIIIGVLGAIGSLSSLVRCIIAGADVSNTDMNEDDKKNLKRTIAFLVIYAIISGIQVILNILLVVGASQGKPRLIKPWIVTAVISATIVVVAYLAQIIIFLVAGVILPAILGFVIITISMCISVYLILVVNSFHTELTSQHYEQL